jgi:hypothetical protein
MHRDEMDQLESCADCQAEIRAAQDRAFVFGTTGVLCSACAARRGGRYDAGRDAWVIAPEYRDLEAEFR